MTQRSLLLPISLIAIGAGGLMAVFDNAVKNSVTEVVVNEARSHMQKGEDVSVRVIRDASWWAGLSTNYVSLTNGFQSAQVEESLGFVRNTEEINMRVSGTNGTKYLTRDGGSFKRTAEIFDPAWK